MSIAGISAKIRELIKKDEIEKAFELMQTIVPPDLNNTLVVITNRFKRWRKDRMLGLSNNASERNAIVNDLLNLLSDIEKSCNSEVYADHIIVNKGDVESVVQTGIINQTTYTNRVIPPPTSKPWHEKISVLIPVMVALVSGFFLLLQTYMSKEKKNTTGKVVTYELIFIDRQTLRPPVFHTLEPKVKIYNSTPPQVLPIILGTVKFDGSASLESQKIIIEFENITDFQMVDRNHVIKAGKNEILINRVKKNGRQSKSPRPVLYLSCLQALQTAYPFYNQVNYCPNDYSHSKSTNGTCYQPHEV